MTQAIQFLHLTLAFYVTSKLDPIITIVDILTLIQVIQYTNKYPPLIHFHDVKCSLSLIFHSYENIINLPLSLHMILEPLNRNAIHFSKDLFYEENKINHLIFKI